MKIPFLKTEFSDFIFFFFVKFTLDMNISSLHTEFHGNICSKSPTVEFNSVRFGFGFGFGCPVLHVCLSARFGSAPSGSKQ